jgi:diguanylate cyclase (GGDEF)-like protein
MQPLANTALWIAVGVAIGAAALLLLALAAFLVRRRRQAAADSGEPSQVPGGARKPSAPVGLARSDGGAAGRLAEIAVSLELDDVLERTLSAAADAAGVGAAMLVVRGPDAEPLVASVGMTAEEVSRQPLANSPSGDARAVRVTYRYEADRADAESDDLIQGAVAVPLRSEQVGALGTLAVFWRGREPILEDEDLGRLEELAAASAPAIRNAQRYLEARQLADVDALTGLLNSRVFKETLARECARSHRYERPLALVVLDVDDFTEANGRLGRLGGDAVLAAVGARVLDSVRRADVACRVGGDEFGVILPESGARDAEHLYRRLQFAVGSGASGPAERVRISAGIAELRPEDDSISLFQRADEALQRAKEGGPSQVRQANGPTQARELGA